MWQICNRLRNQGRSRGKYFVVVLYVYVCFGRCIPKYRVCLSDVSDCPQYECIGHAAACDKNSEDPACDTEGSDHRSLCHLHQAGKILAYMGRCQVCSTERFGRFQGDRPHLEKLGTAELRVQNLLLFVVVVFVTLF